MSRTKVGRTSAIDISMHALSPLNPAKLHESNQSKLLHTLVVFKVINANASLECNDFKINSVYANALVISVFEVAIITRLNVAYTIFEPRRLNSLNSRRRLFSIKLWT